MQGFGGEASKQCNSEVHRRVETRWRGEGWWWWRNRKGEVGEEKREKGTEGEKQRLASTTPHTTWINALTTERY